jgi:hypothetical protein
MKQIAKNWNKFLKEGSFKPNPEQTERKRQIDIRSKANDLINFGKWEKDIDNASDQFETSLLNLEPAMLIQNPQERSEAVKAARAKLKAARIEWRRVMSFSTAISYKYYMTVKELGGTLTPDETAFLKTSIENINKFPRMAAAVDQLQGGYQGSAGLKLRQATKPRTVDDLAADRAHALARTKTGKNS